MFVNVKDIARVIDREIEYIDDAFENHESVTDKEYRAYLDRQRGLLLGRLGVLKFNSTDRRLIDRYSKKVDRYVAQIDEILDRQ